MSESGYVSGELTLVWLLLITVVVATYFIQSYRVTLLPPSSSALLLGVFFGIVSRMAGLSKTLRFSPAAFFYALLPPIVFAAGFTLKKRAFFDNIGAILTYAVLGTLISTITFGFGTYLLVLLRIVSRSHLGGAPFAECLMYGAAISSIDPVATLAVLAQTDAPPVLYNLVFGESVLNDAVAIILYRSLASASGASFGITTLPVVALRFCILAIGSLAVGVGVALACAFLLKRFDAYYSNPAAWGAASGLRPLSAGHNPAGVNSPTPSLDPTIYEIAIVVMGSYLAYLVAEVVGMSGIVALFFSGICHAHYSHYNVSPDARIALRRFFEVTAFLCELFVFAYLGLQVATMQHSFDFGLVFSGIPLAIGSRAANVFPCSTLVNRYRHRKKLPQRMQRMLWAVGLRGAVAYGLIINMPRTDAPGEFGIPAIETAALLIVVASTLILGSATGPLLRHLDLEGRTDAEVYIVGWEEESAAMGGLGATGPMPESDIGRSAIHERFKELDETILKPMFGGKQGDEDAASPFAHSDAGDDIEGPALRRPLFTDQHYYFGNPDGEDEGNRGQGGGQGANGGPASPVAVGSQIPAAHQHQGEEVGQRGRAVAVTRPAPAAAPAPAPSPPVVADAIHFGDDN